MRTLALTLLILLPLGVRAQTLELEDEAPRWQPTWRFVSGVIALGGGAALLSLSFAWGDRVLTIEDRAIAAGDAAQVVTTEAELLRLRARIDHLNRRGADLETRHLATLASGAVLAAGGVAAILWDRLRDPGPVAVTVSPLPSGVSVAVAW